MLLFDSISMATMSIRGYDGRKAQAAVEVVAEEAISRLLPEKLRKKRHQAQEDRAMEKIKGIRKKRNEERKQ